MKKFISVDGNTATALNAYLFSEISCIYPITPSSPMAEVIDKWSSENKLNYFNSKVKVVEMQSEAGAAGAMHGALQTGCLASTYTASQGLLLMIPNMYKMAGELLPGVIHVAARSIASRSLSILGDHQDIYAARQTGMCMISSHSVQECMDLAPLAHLSAIKASLPFIHFFDGFRTSHEIDKVELIDEEFIKSLIDQEALLKFRKKALNPSSNPITRGGAENDDIYFPAKEAQNVFYDKVPDIVNNYMLEISKHTGRDYKPFTYYGSSDAENIIIAMGSVTETIKETIDDLNLKGYNVGLIKVHLYRPFSVKYLKNVLPNSCKKIAVLDRTIEVGSREPLYLDVVEALKDLDIKIVGGRYGLSSRNTTYKEIKAVYDLLTLDNPKEEFTIGINDDVRKLSLSIDENYFIESKNSNCLFYGLGSDGTVSANKSSIKIIGDNTDFYTQAYFQYDSKKSGGVTRSHLRFGKNPIRSTYYIEQADFISISLEKFCFKYDSLKKLKIGGTVLLNTSLKKELISKSLPNRFLKNLADKNAKFYIIDATHIALNIGMGKRTNTIMQSAFFYLNQDIIDYDTAKKLMKDMAYKAYLNKGLEIVELNYKAIDSIVEELIQVDVDPNWSNLYVNVNNNLDDDKYFNNHVNVINSLDGYDLSVSNFLDYGIEDGSILNNYSYKEKRCVSNMVPKWNKENCIQCNICSFICPHATIRPILLNEDDIKNAPKEFDSLEALKPAQGLRYRIEVSAANCVGCTLCVSECPGKGGKKALEMVDIKEVIDNDDLTDYLYHKVENKTDVYPSTTFKASQFLKPYFEVSDACPGCGETPYYKLASQLFGQDMIIANATGCSSIYSSSTPCSPFVVDSNGKGPAWANSLFEDNAEFGFGMAISQNYRISKIVELMQNNITEETKELFERYIENINNRDEIKKLYNDLIKLIENSDNLAIKELLNYKHDLVPKSIWIIGGDGWAYDIGYGGLDHVLANNLNVNILCLDTEVYSNTGGQSSKSSQISSIAKFASGGKVTSKKDICQIAMSYGSVYVASVSMGANRQQCLNAFKEAESYDGPSLIVAYSPCIEHGIKKGLSNHQQTQKLAVECGYNVLFRYDPRKEKPLTIDSREPNFDKFEEFLLNETRYQQLIALKGNEEAKQMFEKTRNDAIKRYKRLKNYLDI